MGILPFRVRFLGAGTLALMLPIATAQTPKSYDCKRAVKPPVIDGKLDDSAWKSAAWSTDFVDIEGNAKPLPRFRTRMKMLWDETYLYIGAELEEPDMKAKL